MSQFFILLDCMAQDPVYSSCKNEVDALGDKFSQLDCTFLLVLWHAILESFHKSNLSLQKETLCFPASDKTVCMVLLME